MTKTTTFVLSVLLAATSPISSVSNAGGTASLYVAKHGSDSYSCSQASNPSTPKLTIGNALDCISPSSGAGANKIIEVAAGTYAESLIRSNSFPKGSSWSAPFTLRARSGDKVIIRPNSASFVFQINDEESGVAFYTIIQGFIFDAANTNSGNVVSFAPYARFIGNQLINNEYGCALIGSRTNFEFINNKIHGGKFYAGGGDGGDYCYPVYWAGDNALFEGNELYDFPSFGFHLYPNPNNAIIRNNLVRDFGWAANCPRSGDPKCAGRGHDDRGVGILTSGRGHNVYNNIVSNGTHGINLYTNGGNHAYGNTVYNMNQSGIISGVSTGNVVKNNIVYNPVRPRDGDILSYQSPDTTTYGNNLCARSGTGCSLVVDPLFVDAANGNFSLQAGTLASGIGAIP